MWMGPNRRCETGFLFLFFWYFLMAHTVSPPIPSFFIICFIFSLIFCAIYTLEIQTINICSK